MSKNETRTMEKSASKKQSVNTAGSVAERRKKRTSVKPQESGRREKDDKKKKNKAEDEMVDDDLSAEEEPEYVPDPKESAFVDHLVEEPLVNLLRQLSLIRQKRWKVLQPENTEAEMMKIVKTIIAPELSNLISYLGSYKDIKPIHLTYDASVKGVLTAEIQLIKAQDNIKSALKQGQPASDLLATRNAARAKFIEAGTVFYEWMNEKVELDNLENQYRNSLSHIEAEVALSRSNNFDFIGAEIHRSSAYVNQERVVSEVQKAAEAYSEWRNNYANYLSKAARNTEEKASIVGKILQEIHVKFADIAATVDDDAAVTLFTAEKLNDLSSAISEEYKVMNDAAPANSFPKSIIVDAIGFIIRDFKVAMQEIDELRDIEKRLAIVLNEVNDWVEMPNIEDSKSYQSYVSKRVAAASLKKEVAFLEFQMKDLQSVDQFYTEASEAESKKKLEELKENTRKKKEQLRLTNQEAEGALKELSSIAQFHFPELSVYPKLDLHKFITADELLLENRSLSDYASLQLVKGERNQIYKVVLDNADRILKEFTFIKTEEDRNTMIQQTKLLHRLDHPNLCQIEAIFFNRPENYAYIQMPYYHQGDLIQWQKKNLPDMDTCRHLFRGILRGLSYLHHNGVVHCNICPTRIVVHTNAKEDEEVDESEKFIAKILPWELTKSNDDRCVHSSAIAKSKLVGNIPEYVAPELAMGEHATKASDMFSMGLVMYDLLFVFKEAPGGPSAQRSTFLETMKNEGKIDLPAKLSDANLGNLLTSLLSPVPSQRLTARDALDHVYFNSSLEKSAQILLSDLNSWKNDQYAVVKNEEIHLLNERQQFFQITARLHALRHKFSVLQNVHRLGQLSGQQEWAKKPNDTQKQELRKERLALERKESRLSQKMQTLEDDKQKWRKKFYQSVIKQRQVKLNWITLTAKESVSKAPQEWTTSGLAKLNLSRTSVLDQMQPQVSKLLKEDTTLVSLDRVQNTLLWQQYVQCRESQSKFGTRKSFSVTTDQPWMHSQLHIANYVNEVLLWYPISESGNGFPTVEDQLQHIVTQGFSLSYHDLRCRYGYGVYFYESLDAALSETQATNESLVYLLLCRVCLGTPFVTTKALYGITSPPFSIEEKEKPKKSKKESKEKDEESEKPEAEEKKFIADSVVAKVKPHRQFVVYDKSQAYPEFIVSVKYAGKQDSARGEQINEQEENETAQDGQEDE